MTGHVRATTSTRLRSRRTRVVAVATSAVAALSLTFAAGVAFAADPKLEDADLLLEKAAVLLEASVADGSDAEVVEQFDRKRDRAVEMVERARQQILKAQQLVDEPGDG